MLYYSPSTGGFYDTAALDYPSLPEDRVEITADEYRACFEGQARGARIEAGPDGRPRAEFGPDAPASS